MDKYTQAKIQILIIFSLAREFRGPALFPQQPEPVLLELCLFPDGHHVHCG